MKIGVDAREFVKKGKTGICRYLENLLAPLMGRSDLNFIFFVYRAEFLPDNLRAPSVKTVALPALPTLIVDQVVLPHLAQQENIDVFFSPYYKIPFSGKFKRIITVHDIIFLRHEGLSRLKRFLVARQLQVSTRKADIILVDSDFTGADLIAFAPNLQGKIRRLYPDLGSEWLKPIESANICKTKKTYTDGKPFFLYVGTFHPYKNVHLLVQAFAQLVKGGYANDKRLLLVGGDKPNLPRIESLIFRCGMATRIIICPNVSDDNLRALYTAADWFITASCYEGFGYPLLEAFACGCPVICHPCSSIPEVVGNAALEISSLTIEGVMQALRRACSMKPAEKLNFAARGKNQAKQFLPGSAAGNFSGVLSSLA